jgi:hypothetical protein
LTLSGNEGPGPWPNGVLLGAGNVTHLKEKGDTTIRWSIA